MVSLLEGGLRAKIAKGFRGKLTRGILRRVTILTTDVNGDPLTTSTTNYPFVSGIREDFSATFKVRAGIPDTDVSILILLGSFSSDVTPKPDDLIYLNKPWLTWHQVRRVLSIDPAKASARLQAFEIPTPED